MVEEMQHLNGTVRELVIPFCCSLNGRCLEHQDWKFVSFRSLRMRHPESPSQVALPEREPFFFNIAVALKAPRILSFPASSLEAA